MIGNDRMPLWLCSAIPDWGAARKGHAAIQTVGSARAGAGWLVSRNVRPRPGMWGAHGLNCPCCQVHDEVVQALNLLFQDRVRGKCGDFVEIVLLESAGRVPMRAASLGANRLIEARFRLRNIAPGQDIPVPARSGRRIHQRIEI